MLSHKMSIEGKVLRFLYDGKFRHAILTRDILHNSSFGTYKPQSVRNALTKLTHKDLIQTGEDGIMLRAKGKSFVEQKVTRLQFFNSPFAKSAPKNLLVMFDIPEDRKGEREWFRKQLREFGYEMIQRSVWLGPSPLPKDFVRYVKGIGLKDCIKTFKLARNQTLTP